MTYKIAVASSDGQTVNQHFGSASFLKIYAVEGLDYQFLEDRRVESEESEGKADCQSGCSSGCSGGNGSGCSGGGNPQSVEVVADCRAVVAAKIGKNARRLLELKAISVFDIEIPVEESLTKITSYYHKLDSRALNRLRSTKEYKE